MKRYGARGDDSLSAQDVVIRKRVKDTDDWQEVEEEMRGALTVDDLSDDQREVFDNTIDWFCGGSLPGVDPMLLKVGGFGGTGKTTVTSIVANTIINGRQVRQRFNNRRPKLAFAAYTGKATGRLRQKLRSAGIHANREGYPHFGGTIHSLIYKPITNEAGEVIDWKRQDQLEYDLIVIDEASMVDEKMLEDLQSYDIPILAIGDHGQLLPVKGQGGLMLNPDLKLEKIHRQAEGSSVIRLSKYIRDNGNLPSTWDDDDHVRFINFDGFVDRLGALYKEGVNPNDIAILTYTNKLRQNMNHHARCIRNDRDMSETPQKDDLFMCLRNMKGAIFNGMRGTLETVPLARKDHWYEGTFFFPDDELEADGWILREQLGREKTFASWDEISRATGRNVYSWGSIGMLFDYGYALTVHKAQGSEFKHVFVIYEQPKFALADEYRRWLYTAVTRSSRHLYIVVG